MLFRDIYKQSWEISLEKYLLDFSIFSICVHLCICILKKKLCALTERRFCKITVMFIQTSETDFSCEHSYFLR